MYCQFLGLCTAMLDQWLSLWNICSQERRKLWRMRQLTAYTCSVWVIIHRVLYYFVALGVVISQTWPSLRPASLYVATPLLFLVAYNLVGCVFEAVRSQGEWYAACRRIQVNSCSCCTCMVFFSCGSFCWHCYQTGLYDNLFISPECFPSLHLSVMFSYPPCVLSIC